MLELQGKYAKAIIYNDDVEKSLISQILNMLNLRSLAGSKIRIMPDCHPGKGCVIGTTIQLIDSVIPNLVGVDIGCGVLAIRLKEKRINLSDLDSIIHKKVPSGGSVHDNPIFDFDLSELKVIHNKGKIRQELALKAIGSLGGGNHFIEIDKDDEGNNWLLIHSGSRHLGMEVCDHYQYRAYEDAKYLVNNGTYSDKQQAFIDELKRQGRTKELEKELKKFKQSYVEIKPDIPFELVHCSGSTMTDYMHDMEIVQSYASKNRRVIASIILKNAKLHEIESFDTIHNYIDTNNMILRKGAISAQLGEKILIPMNMKDGALICIGKGNPEWNFSAPHGAGRLLSRAEAKSLISVTEYKKVMKEAGIYSTSVGKGTVDESPMVYKDAKLIESLIEDTVDIVQRIKPIYNFKASREETF